MADQNIYEPMDIDLSAHSNNAMDISYNTSSSVNDNEAYLEADDFYIIPPAESVSPNPLSVSQPQLACKNTLQPTHIKKFCINMQKEKKSRYDISLRIKITCSIAILLLSLATYQVLNIQCSGDINPHELKKSMSAGLFGQSHAIISFIEALSVAERSKIIFFYGGTGVGKTFTASLILEHIGYYSNVYHYVMPSFLDTFTTDFMIGLSVCKHTTIIIDDLSAKDMLIRSHVKDIIAKSQNLNKDVTIILIYNCDNAAKDFESSCDDLFPNKLLQNFNYIGAFKKLIHFKPLKEEHLKQCIDKELGNITLRSTEYQNLLKNFNVSQDGCKGVYSKIKMLDIS